MRQKIIFYLIIISTSAFGQRGKVQLELAADAFGKIEFDSMSLNPSDIGKEEVKKLGTWFKENNNDKNYSIVLSGTSNESEIRLDRYIGVKRCKIVMDSIGKYGLEPIYFYIIDEQRGNNKSGVTFIINKNYKDYIVRKNGKTIGHKRKQESKPFKKVKLKLDRFEFEKNTLSLSPDGQGHLAQLSTWLSENHDALYLLNLYGIATEEEITHDQFIDVKRCKVIMDSLSKQKAIDRIFIRSPKIQKARDFVGVGFTLEKMISGLNKEDEYFNDNKQQ